MSRLMLTITLMLILVLSVSWVSAAPLDTGAARPMRQACGIDLPCTATPSGSATVTATPSATSPAATAAPSATPLPPSFIYRLYVISIQR